MRGDFVTDAFVEQDFNTDHSETKVVSNPNVRLFIIGIVLAVVGLACQLLAQGIRGGW